MSLFHGMEPRNIGPAGMSGRITSIDVNLSDPDQIFLGAAAGGIWKSENSGHTWEPIFDNELAASIGSIAIFQKNPSIIYVGTGEGNPRNSQNSGRGMFKSIDGGKTWQHLGLTETRQIHRVIVHPDNADIVWAGVSGATWGESEERGVYKSVDGGQSWRKVLYTNQNTGVSDLVIVALPESIATGMDGRGFFRSLHTHRKPLLCRFMCDHCDRSWPSATVKESPSSLPPRFRSTSKLRP